MIKEFAFCLLLFCHDSTVHGKDTQASQMLSPGEKNKVTVLATVECLLTEPKLPPNL